MCANGCAWLTGRPRASTSPPTIPAASPRRSGFPWACRSRSSPPLPTAPRPNAMLDCIVAEDEALLRDALVALLRERHADSLRIVAECEDGGEALEAIAEHKPAVAFLDIRMP